jgi:hypothetical protein
MNKIEAPERKRNRVVHSPIIRKDGEVVFARLQIERKLIFKDKKIEEGELLRLIDEIQLLTDEFFAIFPRDTCQQHAP